MSTSNFLTTVKGSKVAQKIRSITAALFSPNDAKSAQEIAPFGYDAPPVPGMTALYIKTNNSTQPVFIGYINENQLAEPGESRIYATDANGNEVSRIWQHTNGNIEIAGTGPAGTNIHHTVQYEALNTALTNYFGLLNTAIGTSITALGGVYTPPPPIVLTPAKISKILVP